MLPVRVCSGIGREMDRGGNRACPTRWPSPRCSPARPMNERYIRWWTPHLSRDFEMLVFGDGGGRPLILFRTSFGRHTQNKDFGLTGPSADFVDSGKITIYCTDSPDLDRLYNKAIDAA